MCVLQRYALIMIGATALVAAIHGPRDRGLKVYSGLIVAFALAGGGVSMRPSYLQHFPPKAETRGSDPISWSATSRSRKHCRRSLRAPAAAPASTGRSPHHPGMDARVVRRLRSGRDLAAIASRWPVKTPREAFLFLTRGIQVFAPISGLSPGQLAERPALARLAGSSPLVRAAFTSFICASVSFDFWRGLVDFFMSFGSGTPSRCGSEQQRRGRANMRFMVFRCG